VHVLTRCKDLTEFPFKSLGCSLGVYGMGKAGNDDVAENGIQGHIFGPILLCSGLGYLLASYILGDEYGFVATHILTSCMSSAAASIMFTLTTMNEFDFSADLPAYYRELLTEEAKARLDARDSERKRNLINKRRENVVMVV